MSYTRDKDAYTHGSGAIAASDYNNPRRARERRMRLQRTAQRDAMLAGLTYGARGGISSLGLIDANKLGAGTLRRPVVGDPTYDVDPQSRTGLQKPPSGGGGGGTSGGNLFQGAYRGTAPQFAFQPAATGKGTSTGTKGTPRQPTPVVDSAPGVIIDDGNQLVQVTPVTPAPAKKPPWLLIAAVLGGAYLLLRDKGGGA